MPRKTFYPHKRFYDATTQKKIKSNANQLKSRHLTFLISIQALLSTCISIHGDIVITNCLRFSTTSPYKPQTKYFLLHTHGFQDCYPERGRVYSGQSDHHDHNVSDKYS